MRYLGNKTNLLDFIESVINKYSIEGETFADLFSGTSSVGDHFKNKYSIIANDYMYFSYVIAKAKLLNKSVPRFEVFKKENKDQNPYDWLNNKKYKAKKNYFVYNNYTPKGGRMFLTEDNAIKIDGIRLDIEEKYKNNQFSEAEYYFLLASLLESVLKVSNTSGTYQAYFKFWEERAKKPFVIEPLTFEISETLKENQFYNEDANQLVRKISGDIAYIDTPYTINQYTNSYHLLETIARYDNPVIFGKTGRRYERNMSGYSNKTRAIEEFEDLFRQLNFKHILVSYSNQGIIPIKDLVNLAKKFAKNGKVYIEKYAYREYATNNLSYKGANEALQEVVLYFEKDNLVNKSPLNYSGSKDEIVSLISKYYPKHIGTFVDAMGGAFNVGANVVATDKVVYNEYNKHVFNIVKYVSSKDKKSIIEYVENTVKKYSLHKKDKEAYLKLRDEYNKTKDDKLLFVLQIYAFQNMIRFNSTQQMNTPVGNNEYCQGIKERILNFVPKTKKIKLINSRYQDIDINKYPKDTLFYFDPPYFITTAEYNDGKRGQEGWDVYHERELLNYLSDLDKKGYMFMLSNVIKHNGKEHTMLINWANENNYQIYNIGKTGIKYPREEVVVVNYGKQEKETMNRKLILNKECPQDFENYEISVPAGEEKIDYIEKTIIKKINKYNPKLDIAAVEYANLDDQFENLSKPGKRFGLIVEDVEITEDQISKNKAKGYYTYEKDKNIFSRRILEYVFITPALEQSRDIFISQTIFPELLDIIKKDISSPTYQLAGHPFMLINMLIKGTSANSIKRSIAELYQIGFDYVEIFDKSLDTNDIPTKILPLLEKYDSSYESNYNKKTKLYSCKFYDIDENTKTISISKNAFDECITEKDGVANFDGSKEKFVWMRLLPIVIIGYKNRYNIDISEYENFIKKYKEKFKENSDKFARCETLLKYYKKYLKRS